MISLIGFLWYLGPFIIRQVRLNALLSEERESQTENNYEIKIGHPYPDGSHITYSTQDKKINYVAVRYTWYGDSKFDISDLRRWEKPDVAELTAEEFSLGFARIKKFLSCWGKVTHYDSAEPKI